jgi:hypothetical protein
MGRKYEGFSSSLQPSLPKIHSLNNQPSADGSVTDHVLRGNAAPDVGWLCRQPSLDWFRNDATVGNSCVLCVCENCVVAAPRGSTPRFGIPKVVPSRKAGKTIAVFLKYHPVQRDVFSHCVKQLHGVIVVC